MVIGRITMGLGNQMFQYAAARSLSLTLGQPLKLDISSYQGYTLRKFELEKYFNFSPQIATSDELSKINLTHPMRLLWNKFLPKHKLKKLPYEESKSARLLYQVAYILRPPHKQAVYEERQFNFDKNFFLANKNVYLKGYWMSPRYFSNHAEIIKKDFTVKAGLISHLQQVADGMQSCNSIAVHVRCTDKLDANNLKLYGDIPQSYYAESINYIINRKKDARVYLFSDDIEIAKKYIPENIDVTYISGHITKNAIEDFYLMTQCKNIIIPNSTFSWWAAYLNANQDKIVIAPKRWYNDAPYNYEDIYVSGWIKMNN